MSPFGANAFTVALWLHARVEGIEGLAQLWDGKFMLQIPTCNRVGAWTIARFSCSTR